MAELRRNLVPNTMAGVTIGLLDAVNEHLVYGVPPIYDIFVRTIGRYGEGVFGVVMGFALDFVADRAPFLTSLRIPERWYVLGIYKVVKGAMGMVTGEGFAVINSDGSIKTDPEDTVSAIYMQSGDSVVQVRPGSPSAQFGIARYVAVGAKRVFYFKAPYKLPSAT